MKRSGRRAVKGGNGFGDVLCRGCCARQPPELKHDETRSLRWHCLQVLLESELGPVLAAAGHADSAGEHEELQAEH